MLHIVKEFSVFKHCLNYTKKKEAIIFIENGIFCAFIPNLVSLIKKNQKNITYYLLSEHLALMPEIKTPKTLEIQTIHLIDYQEFVKLVVRNPQTLTWH